MTTPTTKKPSPPPAQHSSAGQLKLVARDMTDLTVLSTLLQDAVVEIRDMHYNPAAQQFLMVVSRLIRPSASTTPDTAQKSSAKSPAKTCAWRRKTGVHIAGIELCKHCGIVLAKQHAAPLMLLSITYGGDAIDLVFSGDVMLKLKTSAIEIYAVDLDEEGWPTRFDPSHQEAFDPDTTSQNHR